MRPAAQASPSFGRRVEAGGLGARLSYIHVGRGEYVVAARSRARRNGFSAARSSDVPASPRRDGLLETRGNAVGGA